MMKSILLIIALCIGGGVSAQETIAPSKTLENQFDEVYRTSNSYNTYKVIRKVRFQNLKLQTLDSVSRYKKQLSEKDSLLHIEKQNYKSVKEQESKTQLALSDAKKNENNISFFGSELSKTSYNLLLWSIILLLLVSLLYFIYSLSFLVSGTYSPVSK